MSPLAVILGCGDIGKRLALSLVTNGFVAQGLDANAVVGTNRSGTFDADVDAEIGIECKKLDLDEPVSGLSYCHESRLFYLIPPQKSAQTDERSAELLSAFEQESILPKKVVLLSTTGVYGDSAGEWVDESSPCLANTDRARRRLDAEQQWMHWGDNVSVPVVVVRVPGIYAHSRIPRRRLESGSPVVRPQECGFTNRIHADDLVQVLCAAMRHGLDQQVYNASDGYPGKVSEFLQAAASEIGVRRLPEISLEQANEQLSEGMMSYLRESRRINNEKMLSQLKVKLRYPNFVQGLKFG